MSRTERLLDLLQLLREHRHPVAGPVLARDLGVSLRTIYRDIATLQGQGADIEGEPGLGYVMRPGFTLPPLMFTPEELEALVLGSRWVIARAEDYRLGQAAGHALAKIGAVLPAPLRDSIDAATLVVVPSRTTALRVDPAAIREAIRNERKVTIAYTREDGTESQRTIWPIVIAFFENSRIVTAWCELRQDYRAFRIDRMNALTTSSERYPRRRHDMLKEWRARESMPDL